MSDFQFSFDATMFPTPPVPSSADLFSVAETSDLIGFLDNFGYSQSAYPDASVARRSIRKPIATPTLPNTTSRARPLLSTPQKRLNHIMSEQKRRNAIRDGYAQLITLLAPAGSGPAIDMPSRGRPKGSGSRNNGQTKGKSGVLFRAVEYCRWLEEGRDALLEEVIRTETAAEMSIPNFNLRIDDLAHDGVPVFLHAVNPLQALQSAVEASFKWLYGSLDKAPTNVEVILLVLRAMPGVAYTTGSHSHKEIHLSLDYILKSADRAKDEIMGVLVHEVVHCYQYNGQGKCPGGLIEGIADFVRMCCSLSPPHWAKSYPPKKGDAWDAGYEKTAFFLLWIEQRYGDGSIRDLNQMLKSDEYDKKMFKRLTGRKLDKLWSLYCTQSSASEADLVIIHKDEV